MQLLHGPALDPGVALCWPPAQRVMTRACVPGSPGSCTKGHELPWLLSLCCHQAVRVEECRVEQTCTAPSSSGRHAGFSVVGWGHFGQCATQCSGNRIPAVALSAPALLACTPAGRQAGGANHAHTCLALPAWVVFSQVAQGDEECL